MLCSNCGRDNGPGTVFCIHCGAKMPEPAQGTSTFVEAPPQQSGSSDTNGTSAVPAHLADTAVLGTGEFTLMELIARIPIVNLVMFCVWGFGGDGNENKRNWARSRLIWLGIGVALSIIGLLIGVGLASGVAAGLSGLKNAISYSFPH